MGLTSLGSSSSVWRELHLALGVVVGLRQAEQSPYTVTQELQELPEICLTLHVTFTVLLAGEGVLEAWGVLVQGQSMSQRDLFSLRMLPLCHLPCVSKSCCLSEGGMKYLKI